MDMGELRKSLVEIGRIIRPIIMGWGCPGRSTVKVYGEWGHIGKEYLQLVPGGLPEGGGSASGLSTPALSPPLIWPYLQPLPMGSWGDPYTRAWTIKDGSSKALAFDSSHSTGTTAF